MKGVKRNILRSLIDFIYSGETNLEPENLEDFMKLIAELYLYPAQEDKIVNSPELDIKEVETNRKQCKFCNRGFCKEGAECQLYYSKEDCEKHISYETCKDTSCDKRHRQTCKYWLDESCKIKGLCEYLHKDPIATQGKFSRNTTIDKNRNGRSQGRSKSLKRNNREWS